MTAYDSIIARLLALHPKRIDLSLDRVWRLLDALGNPQRQVPPVIHVAGTNGKGSTIAFMRAMLEAAGRSVHVYTSPHLVRFNERFRIAGTLVSDEALAAALEECERANGGEPITVFEIETAAGFLLFSRNPADVLLLEVGLGGRLDATNVIEKPLASVITPVSMDHLEFLGDTLEKIAAEKAAILKRGVPGVIAPQSDVAMAVIERQAQKIRAPLHAAGEHWNVHEEHGRLVYQDEDGLLDLPAPKLNGRHQFDNAGVAIAALRASGLKLPNAAYRDRHRQGGLAGAPAASLARRAEGAGAAGQRAVARRRPQRRRRPRGGCCDRQLRGARGAAAGADRRHALDQGLRRLSAQFLRPGAPRVRDPDPEPGEEPACRSRRAGGAQRRHSRRALRHRRGSARRGIAPGA